MDNHRCSLRHSQKSYSCPVICPPMSGYTCERAVMHIDELLTREMPICVQQKKERKYPMRKRSIPQVRKGFAAPTRPTREVWRSITICMVKIVCYVGSALFLFSLIIQLSSLYPSLWLFPPLWVDRIIIAMIG